MNTETKQQMVLVTFHSLNTLRLWLSWPFRWGLFTVAALGALFLWISVDSPNALLDFQGKDIVEFVYVLIQFVIIADCILYLLKTCFGAPLSRGFIDPWLSNFVASRLLRKQ